MLNRLQKHDRVTRTREILDQRPLKAQVRPGVAEPRVLVGLRIGVNADHARSGSGERGRAVALSAGEVGNIKARHAVGDPLVHRKVAPVPVILLWEVRQGALAGQLERRHMVGLISLYEGHRLRRKTVAMGTVFALMPASPTATPDHIRDVNERYHDAAAHEYDAKWGIDFGEIGRSQTRLKLVKALGEFPATPFGDALEIGAGTGYFALNLMQEGAIDRLVATDISTGMLGSLQQTADSLGFAQRVSTRQADAEQLPFADASFDLVLGHAVLHHIPDLGQAFYEFNRVLRPGGALVFCGEPSRYGDRMAMVPKHVGAWTAPAWRRLMGADARNGFHAGEECSHADDDHSLEGEVDVHAFAPGDLARFMRDAGLQDVNVRGEELLANVYGWWLRSLEASAQPEQVPDGWKLFAYRSYIALQKLDVRLLEPRLPASLFYNLIVSARKRG